MKTIVTIEESRNVKLERFEGDLKAGERITSFDTFLKAMLAECDIEFLMCNLVERQRDLNGFFMNADLTESENHQEFKTFIMMMIKNLSYMHKHDNFQDLAFAILSKLQHSNESKELIEQLLLDFYSRNAYRLKENENLIELTKILFTALMNGENNQVQTIIIQSLIPYLKSLEEKEAIEDWYRFVLQKVDINILAEESKYRLKNYNENYGFTTLPKGCIGVSMSEKGAIYVMEVPKAQFRVKLFDVPYEDVGHPRLIFVIHFDKAKQIVDSIYCAAVKENDPISEDTVLYKYPYSNVFNTGKVCWNSYPTDFNSISMLPSLFLSTSNNTHLCGDIRHRFEKNENKAFDDAQLEPLELKLKNFLM